MELTRGMACHRLAFRWPGTDASAATVLTAVDARFAPGTVSLVTGETGAGKSTFLHLLAGLLRPTAGEVRADGAPISRWPARHRDRWRRRVGMVFQHLALVTDLTAAENLILPLIPRTKSWKGIRARIDRSLQAVDLPGLADTPAKALSGGQRQRLAIARALVTRPRFLFADEPTAFQDDRHALEIANRLHAAARGGAVVVIGSHDPRLQSYDGIDRRFRLVSGALVPIPAEMDSE